jgi:hypothetical protein
MALKSGAIFLAVAFLVASPWYVKNCILTTNPTYPLFDNFFKVFQHANTNDAGASGIQTIGSLGIFGRREILFGENFWETIFIPIRMFFQGEDGSARYFDGVLNSILICMLPFVFIKNSSGSNREKLLFLSFSAFFFFMAYFSAVIRARYILPVIPFLAILSVMGINNLFGWISEKSRTFRNVGIVGIFAVLTVFLLPNVLYMKNYVDTVRPFGYLLGKETRDEFLTRNVASYAVMRYINENLPRDSKIFLMFTGRRGYYLDRSYYCERSFGMNTAKGIVEASKSKEGLQSYLNSLGCTHILIRSDLFDKYLRDNFSNEVIIGFIDEIRKYWKLVCVSNGFAVYAISFNSVGVPSS